MKQPIKRRRALELLSSAALGTFAAAGAATAGRENSRREKLFIETGEAMIRRIIPASGEKLPVVGAGTWIQFDVGTGAGERQALTEVLKTLHSQGGRIIDSSPMYGKSEEVVGDLTSPLAYRDEFFYATKVWTTGKENGIRQMEESFRKMRRKKMDLMQIHNLTDWSTHLRTLRDWKERGLIRYTGITHYTSAAHGRLEEIVKSKAVDFVQFNYSIRVRDAEKSLLKAAADNGVAVIINEPFESGALFSIVKGKELPAWASEAGIGSWGQFFLKFILSHPSVTCVIPGTSNPKHMLDNAGAGFGSLPDQKLRNAMAEFIRSLS